MPSKYPQKVKWSSQEEKERMWKQIKRLHPETADFDDDQMDEWYQDTLAMWDEENRKTKEVLEGFMKAGFRTGI